MEQNEKPAGHSRLIHSEVESLVSSLAMSSLMSKSSPLVLVASLWCRACLSSQGHPLHCWTRGGGGQRGVHLCRWSRSKQKSCIRLCLTGLLSCSEVSHSCPHHLATPLPVPESLHPLHLRGRRGKRRVWVNVRVMVDLDGFQKSTPYALVTEWIIQRYAGSRLICH